MGGVGVSCKGWSRLGHQMRPANVAATDPCLAALLALKKEYRSDEQEEKEE